MKKRDRWNIDTIDLTPQGTKGQEIKEESKFIAFLKKRWKLFLIIFAAVYLVVLVFGAFTVRFYYDEDGNRRLYRLSFSDLQTQDDYEALTGQLDGIRRLLVDISVVDIHLANGEYSNYEAATLYTEILDEQLDVMIPKINSMNLMKDREPIRETMESLLSYDLALYLQKISEGLKKGNVDEVKTALQYRDKALSTYEILETAIEEIADDIKIDADKYFEWELYEAVEKKDSTAVLKPKAGENSE